MKIGIDIDNVLSDFNEVLLNDYLEHDKTLNNSGIIHKDEYIRKMFDWDLSYEQDYYKNNIERIASLFTPIKDSSKYVNKLKEEGNEIYIISGRDNGEYSDPYNMTINWLKEYDIPYDKLILTDAYKHQEKADLCKEIGIDVMIDDSINVCTKCSENDIECILFETPFNKNENRFNKLKNWEEVYNYISNKKINVILDTDTYNECDDQFALSYLIKNNYKFNIEAITVAPYSHKTRNVSVPDGQDLSYNEILKICKWLNFDTADKVFKGSMEYIQNGYDKDNDAVNKIIEIALKNNKTYILGIGAITNIALAIKKEPRIINKIEVIWLGGNQLNYKDNLEYNFRQDIDAVKIVFDSKVRLTILPCKDVISKLRIDVNTLKENIGNKSELCDYLIDRFYNDGYHGIQEERVIWDISVIAYMINKNWFKKEVISCPNIKDDTSYELSTDRHKITIITDIDRDRVYENLFKRLGDIYEIN